MTTARAINVLTLPLAGAAVIDAAVHEDARGSFVKTFRADVLRSHGITFSVREEFYSKSSRGVLRGMHFQRPPFEHQKLVTCLAGCVLDVLLDVRRGSPTYGEYRAIELSGDEPRSVFVPAGVAHGFLSLVDRSCVLYRTDREYSPHHDAGIRWDSFGFEWPELGAELVLSERDQGHPAMSDFKSPFSYAGGAGG